MSEFPWVDKKFEYRINRLIFMIIIELYLYHKKEFVNNFLQFNKMIGECSDILKFTGDIRRLRAISLLKYNTINIDHHKSECLIKLNVLNAFYIGQRMEEDSGIIKFIDKLAELINKIGDLENLIKLIDMMIYMSLILSKFNIENIAKNIDVLTQEFESIDLCGSKVPLIGGDKYKNKYLKYKTKYLKLKNNLVDKK
jgi:hypothetical protein